MGYFAFDPLVFLYNKKYIIMIICNCKGGVDKQQQQPCYRRETTQLKTQTKKTISSSRIIQPYDDDENLYNFNYIRYSVEKDTVGDNSWCILDLWMCKQRVNMGEEDRSRQTIGRSS